MPCQLPVDCLNEIFEYLEKDKVSLYSCLLVNRLWCEVSVRILWRNIWIGKSITYGRHRLKVKPEILNTLIICLPNDSKNHLLEKRILNSTQISKTPLFDYVSFCKVLSIHAIGQVIIDVFRSQKYLTKEIIKMFVKKIYSVKKLSYYTNNSNTVNLSFLRYPGAKECLTNLSKLSCSTDVKSAFFYKLSQICYNIQSLNMEFKSVVSNGLKDLICSQNNLKYLSLSQTYGIADWTDIIPSLSKHSNTLIKLKIYGCEYYTRFRPLLSFVTRFTNLRELILSFRYKHNFSELDNNLKCVIFPYLQILKFPHSCPDDDILIKFLENNGKNLVEFYINSSDSLNLAIAKFCPNLKSLYTLFNFDKIETLKIILNDCQQLESIETKYITGLLSEKDLLETLAKYSSKNFYKLKLIICLDSHLVPKDLEEFFNNWKNRVSSKSFSFIIKGWNNSLESNHEGNMKVFEKYKQLGIVSKFDISY
ncbi:hypothetical protein RhiirA5_411120 [Rhizophagus irregularis]|uniref:F-box domain-containing protein n=3 Tax=Rhizophagus irregularis TaxID=588596 RepID=A0A2N0SE75_9GLOM|nr:hypothetical protein RirG_019450 [Rhizophagus irregularis DAOM 197198w]PKC13011.1 hypothetical protein RhiirA5_411120 [Rhizophagus irregularis]PKC73847.1 hypothetical protein RhiirA1_450690 [Rhizophagus irregularis]UZO13570.1 hypothetical protein OCT59_005067 [Rhizophagus irregularis]GBC21416.1 hypothetical protein GLOIN_2v1784405 [Rhizophagus irregularis DAOM 181602=DAOM 197198]